MRNEIKNLSLTGRAKKQKGRPRSEPKRQKTFYLPSSLVRELRVFAAVQGRPQSEIIAAALEKYLNERAKQP